MDILIECVYCFAYVSEEEDENAPVAEVKDNEAWEHLARLHNIGCEWVETRAHRVFAVRGRTLGYYRRAIVQDGGLSMLSSETETVSVMEAVKILRGLPVTKVDWEGVRSLRGEGWNVMHIIELSEGDN